MPVESPHREEPSQECEPCIQRKKESLLVETVVDEAATSYLRSTEAPPKLFSDFAVARHDACGAKKIKIKKQKNAPVARYRGVL